MYLVTVSRIGPRGILLDPRTVKLEADDNPLKYLRTHPGTVLLGVWEVDEATKKWLKTPEAEEVQRASNPGKAPLNRQKTAEEMIKAPEPPTPEPPAATKVAPPAGKTDKK